MTQGERVKVRLNFINAHIVSEVAKYLRDNPKVKFFKRTGFNDKDLQKMINLEYEWDLNTVAIVSELVGFDIILIGNKEKNY